MIREKPRELLAPEQGWTTEGVAPMSVPLDKPRRSRWAEASLGLGLLSFVIWGVMSFSAPAVAGLGVLFGILALRSMARKPVRLTGRRFAKCGIAIGVLHLTMAALAFFANSTGPT